MRITTSDQLLARLDAGANLKLENGIVKTEGGLAHAMRKIGDFFRSFTEAGRTAIRERSANLRAAMGDLLRSGMDQELAAAVNLPEAGATRSRKAFADSLERIRMARILGAAENRPQALRTLNLLQSLNMPTGIMRKALEFCAAPRTEENLRAMRQFLTTNLGQGWLEQKGTHVDTDPDSIHATWPIDIPRGFVSTINGRPPDADCRRQIIDLIPNPAVRGFVTFLTCQAGMAGSISDGLSMQNADSHAFTEEEYSRMMGRHTLYHANSQQVDLRIENDVAIIEHRQSVGMKKGEDSSLGAVRYDVELRVPLDQKVRPGGTPRFEITSLRCTPLAQDSPPNADRA